MMLLGVPMSFQTLFAMSFQKIAVFFLLPLIVVCGCSFESESVVLVPTPERLVSLHADKVELVSALREYFYETLMYHKEGENQHRDEQNISNPKSLQFSFGDRRYDLKEAIELFCEILKEVEYPVLFPGTFEHNYIAKDVPYVPDMVYFQLRHTFRDCVDICANIEDWSGFISTMVVWSSVTNRLCVYDYMSYHWCPNV